MRIVSTSRHVRGCCLHCCHGHGPLIGQTDKTRFLSTHNGCSHYILKAPFKYCLNKVTFRKLIFLAHAMILTKNESHRLFHNEPPPLEKAVHGVQIVVFLSFDVRKVCYLLLLFLATLLSEVSNDIANSNER